MREGKPFKPEAVSLITGVHVKSVPFRLPPFNAILHTSLAPVIQPPPTHLSVGSDSGGGVVNALGSDLVDPGSSP